MLKIETYENIQQYIWYSRGVENEIGVKNLPLLILWTHGLNAGASTQGVLCSAVLAAVRAAEQLHGYSLAVRTYQTTFVNWSGLGCFETTQAVVLLKRTAHISRLGTGQPAAPKVSCSCTLHVQKYLACGIFERCICPLPPFETNEA